MALNQLVDDVVYLGKNFQDYVSLEPSLYKALALIAFNPIFWNIAARLEYNTHILTKLAFGNRKWGCYILAATIFSLGIVRDEIYYAALKDQPTYAPFAESTLIKVIAAGVFGFGNILVLTSMWALGVTGTYLGDYFGILMKERVTGFPFNFNDNPMYNGSTLCFLGTSLWFGKPTGLLVTVFVFFMYKIALMFEEPFTAKIYANRAKKET